MHAVRSVALLAFPLAGGALLAACGSPQDGDAEVAMEKSIRLESAAFKDWAVPMQLGEPARKAIQGHSLDYYLNALKETREKTLSEFRKRDDHWLLAVDKSFPWGPTNNLCKWFHVCEHESHHTGQISLLKSRAPGAKPESG